MIRPVRPRADSCFHTSASYGWPELISSRSLVSGLRSATRRRTDCLNCSSSSLSISAIAGPLSHCQPFRPSTLPQGSHAQLVERCAAIDAGVLRQAEDALADDVALDLVRAA